MKEEILYQVEEKIAVLTINRPAARNALSWSAQEQFTKAVEAVAEDSHLRVIIITGAGDKAFASGGDLKELIHHAELADGVRLNRLMSEALQKFTQLPIPVIAAVNGDAIGGGCEIMTACDFRLAVPQARFRFAQVQVALTTGWGGAGRLVHLLGQSRAMELLLSCRTFGADEAQRIGFVHRLTPEGEKVLQGARRWAEELVALPRHALSATKALVLASSQLPLVEVYQLEAQLFAELWPQADHLEAMSAFVEKRKPIFNQDG
jgi:enoyl-CoA hydratase